MSPAEEWAQKRQQRESGTLSGKDWLKWANRYVSRLDGGPWRKHCETHIRFVERQVRDGLA